MTKSPASDSVESTLYVLLYIVLYFTVKSLFHAIRSRGWWQRPRRAGLHLVA